MRSRETPDRPTSPFDLGEDVLRRCSPNERLWILIVRVEVLSDRADQVIDVVKASAFDRPLGQVTEEPLDHVQPRRTGWCEVEVEPWIPLGPHLHFGVLVRCVVVANQVNVFVSGNAGLDQFQELQPFLVGVPLAFTPSS